jgi:hypothetical protein
MSGIWSSKPGGAVKSIQNGSITIAGNNTSGSNSITAVNTSKCVLNNLGTTDRITDSSSNPTTHLCRLELSNSTTVTVYRIAPYSPANSTHYFQVIEYR